MREILFRGKRLDNGEWVEGFYARSVDHFSGTQRHFILTQELNANGFPNGLFHRALAWFEVDPATVSQYTGLNDKNDKRIFEGDIVNIEYTETTVVNTVITYIGAGFYGDRYDDCWELDQYTALEVIGNVYDNPELLKGGNH